MRALFTRLLNGFALPYAEGRGPGIGCNPRLMMAVLVIGGTLAYHYLGTTAHENEFTGRTQRLAYASAQEEVALGLQSAPTMIRQMGGESRDAKSQA